MERASTPIPITDARKKDDPVTAEEALNKKFATVFIKTRLHQNARIGKLGPWSQRERG